MPSPILTSRRVHLARHECLGTDAGDGDFLELARRVAGRGPSVVLLSGGDHDSSRYSLAGWNPFAVFTSKGRAARLTLAGHVHGLDHHPLDALDLFAASLRPDFPLVVPPFSGGAMGYAAYELKNVIERLPQTAEDDVGLPDLFLIWPRNLVVYDRQERRLEALVLGYERDPTPAAAAVPEPEPAPAPAVSIGRLKSNFGHAAYLDAVERVRTYIRNGDVYQVNLSQRFRCPFEGDSFGLWEALFGLNPAPFYAFVQAGDHQMVCTSMERFLLRQGDVIETRPIKGTRPRGKTPEEDRSFRDELVSSPKDDAELSMIVDLLRNDLGRVCEGRTVQVAQHKRLEAYQNVHHLVSIVRGRLRPDASAGAVLRATFPGGSITGCPKIRAMEIIDELEPHVRHVYTGSIGYFGFHSNWDLNIAIRTALVARGHCHLSVGGGIVYDSDPQAEFEETLHKGQTFFQVMEALASG